MRKSIRGKLAGVLAGLLLGTTIIPGSVNAEDVTLENVQGSIINSDVTEKGENSEDYNISEQPLEDDDIKEDNIENSQQCGAESDSGQEELDLSSVACQGLINYVGIETSYIRTPGEQKVVVSYGDGTENVSEARLVCEKSDGTALEFDLDVREKELFLFNYAFEEKDAGIYRIARFVFIRDGVESFVELSEIGIEAMFGVNEDCSVYKAVVSEEADISAEELEASVVTVDSSTLENVEADIEKAIEETVENSENEEESSEKSGSEVSRLRDSVLSSIAGVFLPATTAKAAENVVVVLDPGHGGSDPGASANGLIEKNLNLSVALACKSELEQYNGVTVYMTRDSDVYVGLQERANKAKAWGADVFVSLHMNSASAGANGVEVYYPNPNYNSEVHRKGEALADQIQQQLVSLGLGNRGSKEDPSTENISFPDGSRADGYQVIRYNKLNGIPGIIVEHAFLTNPSDAGKLKDPDFVRKLGVADATGIANYFELSKGVSVKIMNKNDFDGTAQIKANGLGINAKVKVWNDSNDISKEYSLVNGRDDLTFNINEFGGARGQYYVEAFNSSGASLYKTSFYVSRDVSSVTSVEAKDNKEIQYGLSIQFAEMPKEVKEIQFATWSEQNGQDDIVWYQGKQSPAGVWTATADIRNHKTLGNYNVHVYATLTNGIMKQVGTSGFTVSAPSLKITVGEYKADKGEFDVILHDIKSASGISKIEIPVWCAANQSDIYWYEAKRQGDGSYKATVNISNHNYATGDYKIHTYVTMENGIMAYTGAAPDKTVALPQIEVSAVDTNGKETTYALKVTNTGMLGNIKKVEFATWSEQGGQDDIIWYQGTKGTNNTWTATADIRKHKSAGDYNVHAYATLANGSMKRLGMTRFRVSLPELSITVGEYNEKDGKFDVVLSNVKSLSGVELIQVPVWCAANQSDIHWYQAKKQNDGNYKITVNIANHNYAVGQYKIHSYVTTGNGMMAFTGAAPEKTVILPQTEVSATDTNGKETTYALKVTNTDMIGTIKNVQFATWSEQGGQDDIIWYQGSKGADGGWSAVADIRKHRSAGEYNVHVYATLANGSMRLLGVTKFNVSMPEVSITVGEYSDKEGKFDIILTDIKSASGVEYIQIPVWCAADQSDIYWYKAEKQNDTRYKVTVNIANHNYATGRYKIHTYVSTGNGMKACAGIAPEKMVTLPQMDVSATDLDGKETTYVLKITNTHMLGLIKNVQFATWSEQGGQDDIIWYQGSKSADNTWTARANIINHKSAGKYNVHVYASMPNGSLKCLGITTFDVANPSAADIEVQEYDEMTGSFKVVLVNPKANSGIAKVEIPVWCEDNQNDIKWYQAKKQEDGNYYVDVNPAFHQYNSGLYKIHAYITGKNGVMSFVKSGSYLVEAKRYTIMGDTTTSVDQMIRYYESSGKNYPSIELGAGGAGTLEQFCQLYYEEAMAEGVRAEVAFTQAMKETGWLQYGGIVQIGQFNFAGLGALDGNSSGNCASFPDVRTGIRAQIQHLKAYGCTEDLVNPKVDPRFDLVVRGVAPYVEYLGKNENPQGIGWATGLNYGYDIVAMIRKLKTM